MNKKEFGAYIKDLGTDAALKGDKRLHQVIPFRLIMLQYTTGFRTKWRDRVQPRLETLARDSEIYNSSR